VPCTASQACSRAGCAATAPDKARHGGAQLGAAATRSRRGARAEEEHAALMQKVDQLNLLRESNAALRCGPTLALTLSAAALSPRARLTRPGQGAVLQGTAAHRAGRAAAKEAHACARPASGTQAARQAVAAWPGAHRQRAGGWRVRGGGSRAGAQGGQPAELGGADGAARPRGGGGGRAGAAARARPRGRRAGREPRGGGQSGARPRPRAVTRCLAVAISHAPHYRVESCASLSRLTTRLTAACNHAPHCRDLRLATSLSLMPAATRCRARRSKG